MPFSRPLLTTVPASRTRTAARRAQAPSPSWAAWGARQSGARCCWPGAQSGLGFPAKRERRHDAGDADLDMTLQTRVADQFDPLSEAERMLLAALPEGRDANCGPDGQAWDAPENVPARADAWGLDRTIRSALLVWLCTDAMATEKIHHLGIRLTGARIDGDFDLSFVDVPFPLWFSACSWPQGMRLRGAAIPDLRLPRCRIGPLPPDGERWDDRDHG